MHPAGDGRRPPLNRSVGPQARIQEGPGFLGMMHSAFSVGPTGEITNAKAKSELGDARLNQRLEMLKVIEDNFIQSNRGQSPKDHADVYKKAVNLMTSKQMQAFKVSE